jgi:hypothetical protein
MVRLSSRVLLIYGVAGLMVSFCWFAAPKIAQAAVCSQREGKSVCIDRLQRSAKNYWEYRVQLTVAGRRQPPTIYDCRSGKKSRIDGTWLDLVPDRIDQTACSLWHP